MSNDQVLTIERNSNASPEAVFDAWTDPEILSQWWGPEGVSIPALDLDVKEGGAWTTTMYSDQMGNKVVSGTYKIVERPSRLVFTWGGRTKMARAGLKPKLKCCLKNLVMAQK